MDVDADLDAGVLVDVDGEAAAEPVEPRVALRDWLSEGGQPDDGSESAREPESAGRGASAEEVAYWRERAEQYEPMRAALEGLEEDQAEAFARLMEITASDPRRARAELARSFGLDVPGLDEPFTLDDVAQLIDEEIEAREASAAYRREVAAATDSIQATARDVGVDPESEDYARLLFDARWLLAVGEAANPRDAIRQVAAATARGEEPPIETRSDSRRALAASL